MAPPSICVVIPVFNAQSYLAQAIASVQLQSFTDWSLIVLDDGSTDRSLDIARAFAQVDPRIQVRHDGQNRGLVSRLNEMVGLTSAPVIARMDADDIMHPDRLATQWNLLSTQPRVDVLGTAAYAIDQASQPYGFKAAMDIPGERDGFLRASPLIHPSVAYRRSWLLRHRYDQAFERAEDYELWWRTYPETTFMNSPEPLLFYRERGLPYQGKYQRSSKAMRRLLRQVGGEGRWRHVAPLLVTSHVKDLAYEAAARSSREELLIERRSRPLTAAELLEARLVLGPILEHAGRTVPNTAR